MQALQRALGFTLFLALQLAFPCESSAQVPPVPPGGSAVGQDGVAREAATRGDAALEELISAAGGWDAWAGMPGLRYQVLETRRQLMDVKADSWRVFHRIPALCHFTPKGEGFLLLEEAREDLQGPSYRREVYHEGAAWVEQGGAWNRLPNSMKRAQAMVTREFLLGAMPFSLRTLEAKLRFARVESEGDRELEVYRVRLPKPVRMHEFEEIEQFLLFVDRGTKRVEQLKWALTGDDRQSFDRDVWWAHADYLETTELANGIRLPARRHHWLEDPRQISVWEMAVPAALEVPPPSLRRPWFTGEVLPVVERADHWDPPGVKDGGSGGAEGAGGAGD